MGEFDKITRMLEIMDEHGLEEFELERDGVRVRLRRPAAGAPARPMAAAPEPGPAAVPPPADVPPDDGTVTLRSPIVGTFYRAPEPGSDPFVEVGTRVTKGQVLCIIEAMKLMNEIDAEVDGEVVAIFVENGQPVQYGDQLFAIKPA